MSHALVQGLESRTLFAAPTVQVDLRPTEITNLPLYGAVGGHTWDFGVKVQNTSETTGRVKFKTNVFASVDGVLDPAGDVMLASAIKSTSIIGGGTYTVAFKKIKLGTDWSNGSYTLFARTTPIGFTDTNPSNDIYTSPTRLSYERSFVDLRLAFTNESALPSNFPYKKRSTIPFTIFNDGNTDANKPVAFGAYLSHDRTYDMGDRYLAGVTMNFHVPAHSSRTFNLSFATNSTFIAGRYYIIGGINIKNTIPEPNILNNWVVTGIEYSI
jgi:hypothetical protein